MANLNQMKMEARCATCGVGHVYRIGFGCDLCKNARRRARRSLTAPKAREYKQRLKRQSPQYVAWMVYTQDARRKGRVWELDRRLFDHMTKQPCLYCGRSANPINGIDRIDNLRGYELDNITTACKTCNHAKHTLSVSEFASWSVDVASGVSVWRH